MLCLRSIPTDCHSFNPLLNYSSRESFKQIFLAGSEITYLRKTNCPTPDRTPEVHKGIMWGRGSLGSRGSFGGPFWGSFAGGDYLRYSSLGQHSLISQTYFIYTLLVYHQNVALDVSPDLLFEFAWKSSYSSYRLFRGGSVAERL